MGIAYAGTVFLLGLVRFLTQAGGYSASASAALYLASFPGSVLLVAVIMVSPLSLLLGDPNTVSPWANLYVMVITSAGAILNVLLAKGALELGRRFCSSRKGQKVPSAS
ncbi:hypothetical protein ACIPSE_44690 [Streptomyces sp. NPDC090106]|uniref:hypothetical protein n=1 Tax=Streptomyces sp. NPDC090106 TaxID=3365946 RepID=UPI0037F35E39